MAKTYSDGEVIQGKGSQLRYAVITAGNALTRPAAGAFKTMKGVTTSEIKGGQETKDTPVDYDSVDSDWADATPGTRNWSMTMSANVKKDGTQAAMFEELRDAWSSGLYVWMERLTPTDTFWRGGLTFVVDPSEPSPSDGFVTFGCGFTGKKALTKTAVV